VGGVLATPNDALAVEYVRQIKLQNAPIKPHAVLREGAAHDAAQTQAHTASASFLRGLIRAGRQKDAEAYMPGAAGRLLEQAVQNREAPFDEKKLEALMLGVLRRIGPEEFLDLPDLSEGLENRIFSAIRQATSLEEIHTLSKAKRYTAARIRRVVMAAFLGLDNALGAASPPYIRVLGFNGRGREILARMKTTAALPVSDSLAYLRRTSPAAARLADAEARSTDLYGLGLPEIHPCGSDFTEDSLRLL
jgi:predicted nucleotidyltransferase